MDTIIEKTISDYPLPISIETTEILLRQLKKNICKICMKDGTKGTGFFCKIPFPDMNNLLTVLITNNHVINESNLNKEEKIMISINNDNLLKVIDIGDRITYTNKTYDVTFIQIYQDKDNINEYLEIDNYFNQEGSNELYSGSSIYVLHYPKSVKAAVSYGILKDIDVHHNYIFSHFCCTENGSSGSPILSISDNKVLGIHRGTTLFNFNKGTFLKNPIKDFIKKIQDNFDFKNYSLKDKLSKNEIITKKLILKNKDNEKIKKNKINEYIEDNNDKYNNKKEKKSTNKLPKINTKSNDNKSTNFDNKLLDNDKISKKEKIPYNNYMDIINKSSDTKHFIPNNKIPNKIKIKLSNNNINEISKNKNQTYNINNNSNFKIQKIKFLNQESFPAYDPSFTYSNSLINLKKSEEEIYNIVYKNKIIPEILKFIKKEIIINYKRIYNNICIPFKNYSKNIMISLSLENSEILKNCYKVNESKEKISEIINKKEIFRDIKNVVKKKIKNKKMAKEIFINNILYTESIIDAASELIENERFYSKNGEPLLWSNNSRILCFKYDKRNPYKLAKFVTNSLTKILVKKYNTKNEINIIKEELEKNKEFENNLEMEETQIKLEISKIILDQILAETIEILSHIELSRKNPKLYTFKSIYSVIDIPLLDFQEKKEESCNNK